MRNILILATAIASLPLAAQAQMMYPQSVYSQTQTSPGYAVSNSEHVLRLPEGYRYDSSATAPNPNSDFPAQRPTYQPAHRSSMAPVGTTTTTTTTVQTTAAVSPRMMPQQADAQTFASMEPAAGTPMPAPVAYKIQDRPANNIVVQDDDSSVQLRGNCGQQLNHRARNKAMNTSTTVFDNCLN